MPTQFRYRVPPVDDHAIARPRLLSVLRGRFDRRLTVLVGNAGFGKTTLLAQAVAENTMERLGTDVWLRIESGDRDPRDLIASLVTALGGEPTDAETPDDVAGYVSARAPEPVALVLDDTHLLDGADAAWTALVDVLNALPENGSLVVAGRTRPALSVARFVADDRAVVIDEETLRFDERELRDFAVARQVPGDLAEQLPPWPALAVLSAVAGQTAPAEYLWEEILVSLPPERVSALASLADLGELDDEIVRAATNGCFDATELLGGLPLVERIEIGDGRTPTWRPHSLWSEVLTGRATTAQRADALRAAAAVLLRRDEFGRAAAASLRAGDRAGFRAAVRQLATRPITTLEASDVRDLQRVMPADFADSPEAHYLLAVTLWGRHDAEAVRSLSRAAAGALADGDSDLAAHACWRQAQLQHLDGRFDPDVLRVVEDAARSGSALAGAVSCFVHSIAAQHVGRTREAVEAIEAPGVTEDFDATTRAAALSNRLTALGWPERVPVTIESAFLSGAADVFGAGALWLRGDLPPDLAAQVIPDLRRQLERKDMVSEQVAVFSILALVCLAVGDVPGARELVSAAEARVGGMARQVVAFTRVADAMVTIAESDDEAGAERLRGALAVLPVERWVARPYLHVIAPLYFLVPEVREHLDRIEFGPALGIARDAGHALVALEAGDRAPAAKLPWERLDLLRAHLPPPLLARVAAAAEVTGSVDAHHALDRITDRALLRRVASKSPEPERKLLEARMRELPVRPPYELAVRTFGGLDVVRSDGVPLSDMWTRRTRARQLLAYLVEQRNATRESIADALWPDVDAAKALLSLRVALVHLRDVLEPDRAEGDLPWFVRADGDTLCLTGEGVRVDADDLEQHMTDAVRAEGEGLPTIALQHYTEVGRLYRGDYLPLFDATDIGALSRIRYRSLAHAAQCRRGELLLARGLPEEATAAAAEAMRLDSLSERAGRLFVNGHLALESRSAARAAADRLVATLEAEGLTPEPATRRLVESLRAEGSAGSDLR